MGGGVYHIDIVCVYVTPFWGAFVKLGLAMGKFSSDTKELKFDVFWANYSKKHPIWAKLGIFQKKKWYADEWVIWPKKNV